MPKKISGKQFSNSKFLRKNLLVADPDNSVGGREIAQPDNDRYAANNDAGDDYDLEKGRRKCDGTGFFFLLATNVRCSLRPSRQDPFDGFIRIGVLLPGPGILHNPTADNRARNIRSSHFSTASHNYYIRGDGIGRPTAATEYW